MGNEIKPFIDDCPICLEESSNLFTLSCGHSFHLYCIQLASIDYILNKKNQKCPYCRNIIKKKDIKHIFKNILSINIKPLEWADDNTIIDIDKIKIKKLNIINIDKYTNIYVPSYKRKVNFFISPQIFNICRLFSDNFIMFSRNKHITEYNEEIPKFELIIDGYINTNKWKKYLDNNFKNNINYKDYNYQYSFSHYKMRFYIKNIKEIICYDLADGSMNYGFIYKYNRKCQILFKTYYIYHKNNIFLINEMFSILYC